MQSPTFGMRLALVVVIWTCTGIAAQSPAPETGGGQKPESVAAAVYRALRQHEWGACSN